MRSLRWILLFVLVISLAGFGLSDEAAPAEPDVAVGEETEAPEEEATKEEEEEVKKPSRDGLDEETRMAVDAGAESFEFEAEVSRLMDIIINSLYSNREIFLRELISNAADALDKVRFTSLTDKDVMTSNPDLNIRIQFDKEHKTVTITDGGIGMTRDDLKKNLGIVAKSGTTEFLEAAAKAGSDSSMSLIGQFGVGFYSVYLVADKVSVVSKHNDDEQHIWESTAQSVFTISKDPRGNTLGRGTQITLHLKEDAEEFLDDATLQRIVGKYSQFVNFPIELLTTKIVTKQIPAEKKNKEPAEETQDEVDISEEEAEEEETQTVKESVREWQRLNDALPIWTRSPSEISEEEYHNFYRSLTKDDGKPLDYIHFVAEGEITFRAILYIPEKAETSLYEKYYDKMNGLKLYVRRVLISDEFEDFLPRYMNFVKGIVDSDDLPLNVSRETLAQSRVLKVMAKKLSRKVLEMLKKMEDRSQDAIDNSEAFQENEGEEIPENAEMEIVTQMDTDYYKFWSAYGKSIKMGIMDDRKNKVKLTKLLRYKTSKSEGKWVSMEEYVDRMPEDQKKIYFLTGESMKQIEENPIKEKFMAKGYEVIYMDESIDEYTCQHLHEFDGVEPINIARESATLVPSKAYKEKREEMSEFTIWLTETLGERVSSVVPTNRLTNTPAVLSVTEYGWTGNMERIAKAQAMSTNNEVEQNLPKKVLEYNPWHPIVTEMNARRTANAEDPNIKDLAHIMYDNAAVVSGFSLENPNAFAERINKVVAIGLDVDPKAEVSEEPEEAEEDEDEAEKPTDEPEEAVEAEE